MNIFFLDFNIKDSVAAHIDAHVSKIPLEAAQMLSTTLWITHVLGHTPRAITKEEKAELDKYIKTVQFDRDNPSHWYKPSYHNHGCNIWARSSSANYRYLLEYALELCAEKVFRFPNNKPHKSGYMMERMPTDLDGCPDLGFTEPYLAMLPDYKEDHTDYVDAYRAYYVCEKEFNNAGISMAKWTNRPVPEWWI